MALNITEDWEEDSIWYFFVKVFMVNMVCSSPLSAGGELRFLPNFQKGGEAWEDLNFKRGLLGKTGVTFFRGRVQFLHKK